MHLNDFARQREFDGLAFTLAQDGQLDLCFRLAAHAFHGVGQRQSLNQRIVELENQVAGFDASTISRRVLDWRNNLDEPVLHADFDAQPAKLALSAHL